MRHTHGLLIVSVALLVTLASASLCAPMFDADDSDGCVTVIVPPHGIRGDDPVAMILGFGSVSAELSEADGESLVLLIGEPYEDGELFDAIASVIGHDRFIRQSELDRIPEFELRETSDAPVGLTEHLPMDYGFVSDIIDIASSEDAPFHLSDEWLTVLDTVQQRFESVMSASVGYINSKMAEPPADRRDEEEEDGMPIHPQFDDEYPMGSEVDSPTDSLECLSPLDEDDGMEPCQHDVGTPRSDGRGPKL